MLVMSEFRTKSEGLNKEDFVLFQRLILEESGIYFGPDQRDSLSLSLAERMQKAKIGSFRDYYNFLASGSEGRKEIPNLLDVITVGETEFFRTPAHFDVLREFILPEIMRRKSAFLNTFALDAGAFFPEPVIKIWSAGCSTGEEPYSIAMTVLETVPQAANGAVSVFTTDVNRERIEKAKIGLYNKKTVRNLGPEILDKYFTKVGDRYEVTALVKKMVRFSRHNLARDRFDLENMRDADIIFCRNVLIYFDLPTTKRIIDNFYDSLNDDGYLIIGPAESLWQISSKFRAVEFPHVFVHRKQLGFVAETEKPFINIPELNLEDILPSIAPPIEAQTEVPLYEEEIKASHDQGAANVVYEEGIRLFKEKDYEKAIAVFDGIIAENPKFIQAYFAKATILSNQGEYEKAIAELKKIIRVDNLFIEAYYLMGVLFNKIGDMGRAIEGFQKVIYIDPAIVLAYFNLGNIFYCQQRFNKAKREFKNAIDILTKRPQDEVVTFSEDVTVGVLFAACTKNIDMVARSG